MMKIVHTAALMLYMLLPLKSKAQPMEHQGKYASQYRLIDSLYQQGMPQSAQKELQALIARLTSTTDEAELLKAELYQMKLKGYEEGVDIQNIHYAQQQLNKAEFPARNIWHSLLAELYHRYYQQYRYQILQRTPLNESEDVLIEYWDARKFFREISKHYDSSLISSIALQSIRFQEWDPLIVKGINADHLRPTLYDLLVFRAIEFYEDEGKDIVQPAIGFALNNPQYFSTADQFIRLELPTSDSFNHNWKVMRHYQELLSLHRNDKRPDARIDADLHRLFFVYRHSTLADKESLYKQALQNIIQHHSSHPLAGLAEFRLIMLDLENQTQPYRSTNDEQLTDNRDLIKLRSRLQQILKNYPDSEAANLAAQQLHAIDMQSLSLTAEDAVLPNEYQKFLLEYKNISKVYVRVYAISHALSRQLKHRHNTKEWYDALSGLAIKEEYIQSLPASEDYKNHRVELPLKPLTNGAYVLVVSDDEDWKADKVNTAIAFFQITELAVLKKEGSGNRQSGLIVVDRNHGTPQEQVLIQLLEQRWNSKTNGYDHNIIHKTTTDAKGWVDVAAMRRSSSRIVVSKGADTFETEAYLYFSPQNDQISLSEETFLFTDRAIYRPGQPIYFKAIHLRKDGKTYNHAVIPGQKINIGLYDVNGSLVEKSTLTTNEMGSVHGLFVAPEGVLTGSMSLRSDHGSVQIRVEEYKRPQFRVEWDTIKEAYALNTDVQLQGTAVSFAGSYISQAEVKYTVQREVRWPYFWSMYRGYFPSSAAVEIAEGKTITDEQGKFTIAFPALPDESISPESQPVFTYTIVADVTDLNGETRSARQSVQLGYQDILLVHEIPQQATRSQLDTLRIRTMNHQQIFVPRKLTIKIYKLKSPEVILRKRLWATPDQHILDSVTYKRYFPLDVWKQEDEPRNWPKEEEVFAADYRADASGLLPIPDKTWNKNGHYLIEMSTVDSKGQPVKEQQVVALWDRKNEHSLMVSSAVVQEEDNYTPGQKTALYFISGLKGANWLWTSRNVHTQNQWKQIQLKSGVQHITDDVTEASRGGIAYNWATIYQNRLYQTSALAKVPWDNKELQISWETHRDVLKPGSKETWTWHISGARKEWVAAELLATLYDQSLDQFVMHQWNVPSLYPQVSGGWEWNGQISIKLADARVISRFTEQGVIPFEKRYPYLINFGGSHTRMFYERVSMKDVQVESLQTMTGKADARNESDAAAPPPPVSLSVADEGADNKANPSDDFSVRENLNETAFFAPQLHTDAQGNISFSFEMPEALTEWKLLAFAHSADFKTALLSGSIKTQKELMVVPNLPRFLRQGDEIVISSKISNLTDRLLQGRATIEVRDMQTDALLQLPFAINENERSFSVTAKGNSEVSWTLRVPEARYTPIKVVVKATAGDFTDGQSNIIPVLTNRVLVTEALPIHMRGSGAQSFLLNGLTSAPAYGSKGSTLVHHALTLEYTPNPAWYVVQALPYIMEYPYDCAEQTFNRYYANSLASHIVGKLPSLERVFEEWSNSGAEIEDPATALYSALEKNQELKSALLQETPWVFDAKNESDNKRRIAFLFEADRMKREQSKALRQLRQMLLPDGAFPWFTGMRADLYITQYITTGLGRLTHLGVDDGGRIRDEIITATLPYLDRSMHERYTQIIKNSKHPEENHLTPLDIQYLYMRSFFPKTIRSAPQEKAYQYYRNQAAKYWPQFNAQLKAMIALALHRSSDGKTASLIITSLKETALHHPEMGMYWKEMGQSWWWWDASIEAQAVLIECMEEVAKDAKSADDMRVWLLKNKQTNQWKTTKATADACYAFLLSPSNWIGQQPDVTITLGEKIVRSSDSKQQAGSGYFKKKWSANEIQPEMGKVNVSVQNAGEKGVGLSSWGALYWQYFEQMDKVGKAATGLVVRKTLYKEQTTRNGKELQRIQEGALRVGDKVVIRIELESDRDMEYVHLKDVRASCFEPINVLSGYRWRSGLGYYESTTDASTNFFIDHLAKGNYVLEYPVWVNNKGTFTGGLTTLQCMYAPEFSAHSQGYQVLVN